MDLVISSAANKPSRVPSIDAIEVLADCLKRNFTINGWQADCHIEQVEVSNKNDAAVFHQTKRSGQSSLISFSNLADSVQVTMMPPYEFVAKINGFAAIKFTQPRQYFWSFNARHASLMRARVLPSC